MAPVYKKEEQHGNPAETASSKEEIPAKNPFTQNTPTSAVPVRAGDDPLKPLPAIVQIKDETFQKIRTVFEQKVKELWDRVEGPVSRREEFEILFSILKNGGELGLAYEPNQNPKTKEERPARMPQEMLEAGRGDCNEFSLLFVVSAQKLGLEISDMDMLVMDLAIRSSNKHETHAAVITTKDGSYLLDPAFLDEIHGFSPADPKNVRSSEISEFYTKSGGIKEVGYIDGVEITERADGLNTMIAINLRETIGVYERKLEKLGGSEKETLRLQIAGLLEEAHGFDPENIKIQKKLIAQYMVLADEAFGKGETATGADVQNRYDDLSRQYCDKALNLYEKCKTQYDTTGETEDILSIKTNAYGAHDEVSKLFLKANDTDNYISELNKMIALMPNETTAHLNKMEFYENLAGKAKKGSDLAKALWQNAIEASEEAEAQFKNDPFKMNEIKPVADRIRREAEESNQ